MRLIIHLHNAYIVSWFQLFQIISTLCHVNGTNLYGMLTCISPGVARYTCYRFSIYFKRLPKLLDRWISIYTCISYGIMWRTSYIYFKNTKEIDGVPVTYIPGVSSTVYTKATDCTKCFTINWHFWRSLGWVDMYPFLSIGLSVWTGPKWKHIGIDGQPLMSNSQLKFKFIKSDSFIFVMFFYCVFTLKALNIYQSPLLKLQVVTRSFKIIRTVFLEKILSSL